MTILLGETKPGDRVRFKNGEEGIVVRHDSDDFFSFTVVHFPQRRRRSNDDSKREQLRRDAHVTVVR